MHKRLLGLAGLACVASILGCAHAPSAPNFTLQDDGAGPWTLADQRGKVVLLTFGFTHCADTCPAAVGKLALLTRALGARGRDAEIAFVTVDPARDTPSALHRFVTHFEPGSSRVVGLTGAPSAIASVENAYHVWSQRIAHGEFAHSSVIFLIDARGRIRGLRDESDSEASLARAVAELLG
ncbi:MAG: SCO family protein [Candidatus Eremiobacteraeota bacterium]|nr:SCO family protein [Candidatus Eremiobacteraeota bacterium]MBV8498034.1 SCO family protein [Candidatus Eremiobacteraeota bacterium]